MKLDNFLIVMALITLALSLSAKYKNPSQIKNINCTSLANKIGNTNEKINDTFSRYD